MSAKCNLKNLSDEALHRSSLKAAHEERLATTKLLHHLKEIERRRYFCKLKYSSLFEFTVKELRYSESQAQRRISAMRLLKEIPEIETQIETGRLTLTTLNLAQNLFSKEKKGGRQLDRSQKLELLSQLEGTSTRDAEKIVFRISPEMKKLKPIDFNSIEDEALKEKLLKLKGRHAHTHPHMNLEELLHKMCDLLLDSKSEDPKQKKKANGKRINVAANFRAVQQRDGHQCANCKSIHAVEVDHIVPRAMGGGNELSNLRLLCKQCNQRAAIEYFGLAKMDRYINKITFGAEGD